MKGSPEIQKSRESSAGRPDLSSKQLEQRLVVTYCVQIAASYDLDL